MDTQGPAFMLRAILLVMGIARDQPAGGRSELHRDTRLVELLDLQPSGTTSVGRLRNQQRRNCRQLRRVRE